MDFHLSDNVVFGISLSDGAKSMIWTSIYSSRLSGAFTYHYHYLAKPYGWKSLYESMGGAKRACYELLLFCQGHILHITICQSPWHRIETYLFFPLFLLYFSRSQVVSSVTPECRTLGLHQSKQLSRFRSRSTATRVRKKPLIGPLVPPTEFIQSDKPQILPSSSTKRGIPYGSGMV